MSAHNILMSASGASQGPLYVDDVFNAVTVTGGTSFPITAKLLTHGGLIWSKGRTNTSGYPGRSHFLCDTERLAGAPGGYLNYLHSDTTGAQNTAGAEGVNDYGITGYSDTSVSINPLIGYGSSDSFVHWVFRKAAKFFDCGTYTGDGNAGRQITHALGTNLGMVIIKATSTTSSWQVLHRGSNGTSDIKFGTLETTNALSTTGSDYSSYFNASTFTPGVWSMNASGVSYVWYAFAHDPSAEGIIQCGSYTGNGTVTGPVVNLGWEPQYVLIKPSSGVGNWSVVDSMRSLNLSRGDYLIPNLSNAESAVSVPTVAPNATGFQIVTDSSYLNQSGQAYIYLAIRRPNKPPTTGTQVYNAIARTANASSNVSVTGTGFAPDFVIGKDRNAAAGVGHSFYDRLRGVGKWLQASSTNAETTLNSASQEGLMTQDGIVVDGSYGLLNHPNTTPEILHFFRRAPGVFDVVCYTGTGAANRNIQHNLNAEPELAIFKRRDSSATGGWIVYSKILGIFKYLNLYGDWNRQSIGVDGLYFGTSSYWWSATTFNLGSGETNTNSGTYIAYLFATKAGISKVGSYTGNGSSQTINCGFSTGARFILIKRTDSTGDWYVWDTARGIISANDPHLSLNTTAAEVTTDDSVDPDNTGFIVNQLAATNINVTSATYIYLAFA